MGLTWLHGPHPGLCFSRSLDIAGVWGTTGCIMDVNCILTDIQFKQLDDKEKRKGRGG